MRHWNCARRKFRKLDSDNESLNFLTPPANYHVPKNANIGKNLEEGSSKDKKEFKGKSKEKA